MTFEFAFMLVLCGPAILAVLMWLCGWAADAYDYHSIRCGVPLPRELRRI